MEDHKVTREDEYVLHHFAGRVQRMSRHQARQSGLALARLCETFASQGQKTVAPGAVLLTGEPFGLVEGLALSTDLVAEANAALAERLAWDAPAVSAAVAPEHACPPAYHGCRDEAGDRVGH